MWHSVSDKVTWPIEVRARALTLDLIPADERSTDLLTFSSRRLFQTCLDESKTSKPHYERNSA